MPHQCLGCGKPFQEGSSELLRGCPGCGGTRFFYTPEPLGEAGLAGKRKEAERDLHALAESLEKEADVWSWARRDSWVADSRPKDGGIRFDAKKLNDNLSLFAENRARAIERKGDLLIATEPPARGPTVAEYVMGGRLHNDRDEPAPSATESPAAVEEPEAPAEPPASAEPAPLPAAPSPQAPEPEAPAKDRVGSVRVDAPGSYDIDVKALLETNPVIIEKDGVYVIHLPSVFETSAKRRA